MCCNRGCGCGCSGCGDNGENNANHANNGNGIPVGYLYAPIHFYSNAGTSDSGNNNSGNRRNSNRNRCTFACIRCSDCFADSCR